MLSISRDIDSLSSFKRRTGEFVRRMKQSRQPIVLTVNGKAELVVQDAESYQRLLELAEYQETLSALKEAIAEMESGNTVSVDEAFEDIRRKHGLSR